LRAAVEWIKEQEKLKTAENNDGGTSFASLISECRPWNAAKV
jgi:hypothetical protein